MKQITLALLMLVLPVLASCGGGGDEAAPVIRPVRYEAVFTTGSERIRSFSGVAEASMESRLSFKVSGTVRRVDVEVGDEVTRGQLLIELDPEDYDLQVQEAQASLTRSEAEARNAEADYDRVRALYENRNASRNDLDAARAGSESAQAQVKSAQKRLELARLQHRVSSFHGTSLDLTLKTMGVDEVFLAGVATDMVVESTARDAHDHDFKVNVIADCCIAANDEDQQRSLTNMAKLASIVSSSDLEL